MKAAAAKSIAHVKVGDVRSSALVSWNNGHLHYLNGSTPGSVTSCHVAI